MEYLVALLLNENASIIPAVLPDLVKSCMNTTGLSQKSCEKPFWLESLLVVSVSTRPKLIHFIEVKKNLQHGYSSVVGCTPVLSSIRSQDSYHGSYLDIGHALFMRCWNPQAALKLDTERVLEYLMDPNAPISPLCRVHGAALMWKERATRRSWYQVAPEIGCSQIEHYCIQVASSIKGPELALEYLMGCPRSKTSAIVSRLDAIWVRTLVLFFNCKSC